MHVIEHEIFYLQRGPFIFYYIYWNLFYRLHYSLFNYFMC